MKSSFIIVALAASAIVTNAPEMSAQDSFRSAIDCIVAANPKVQAALHSAKAESLQLKMTNRLSDPELEGGYQWGSKEVGDKWEISVSQSFDWPGVYQSRSKSAEYKTEAIASLARATENDVRVEAASALIDYVWALKRAEITDSLLQRMQALENAYSKAFQHGETTILDVNKTRLTRIEASRNHSVALASLTAARESVKSMAPGVDTDSLLVGMTEFPVQQMYTLQQYEDGAMNSNPLLRSLSQMVESSIADVSTARRSRMPGFKIGYNHLCELGDHFNGISFGLNLPVFSTRNKVAAAVSSAQAAELEYSREKTDVKNQIYSQMVQAKALASEISNYGPVATDRRPLQLLRQALDGGEINLLTYLQEVAYFHEATMNYIELQRDYHTLLSRLNRYMEQ